MLLGKNGSGKTSILDILGMKRSDRFNNLYEDKNSYFILYHIDEEKFIIETTDKNILKEIKNICLDENLNYEKSLLSLKIKDNQIFVEDFFKHGSEYVKLKEAATYIYISKNVSTRLKPPYNKDEKPTSCSLINRKYKSKSKKTWEYEYSIELNKVNNKDLKFENENLSMEIDFECRINSDISRICNEYYSENYLNLKYDSNSNKENYILNFLERYIIFQFIGIYNNNQKKVEGLRTSSTSLDPYKEFNNYLNNLMKDKFEDTKDILKFINHSEDEYELLNYVINFYKGNENLSKEKCLIYISRYLYFRQKEFYEIDITYQKSIEEFVDKLQFINESNFTIKDKILIRLDKKQKEVINLLEIYDKYNTDLNPSDLSNFINIKFINLSEGERSYFSLYSKLYDELKENKIKNKLNIILLDEPDQTLHPEWSRLFINNIIKMIDKYECKVQVVMSTHSPFMVSDIISNNVYLLEKNNENIMSIDIKRLSDKPQLYNTFGCNIYEILKSGFILDRTMGEFSYIKIKSWLKSIDEKNINEIDEDHLDLIGEKLIREKLKRMYKDIKIKSKDKDKEKLIRLIEQETDEDKIKYILDKIENGN